MYMLTGKCARTKLPLQVERCTGAFSKDGENHPGLACLDFGTEPQSVKILSKPPRQSGARELVG